MTINPLDPKARAYRRDAPHPFIPGGSGLRDCCAVCGGFNPASHTPPLAPGEGRTEREKWKAVALLLGFSEHKAWIIADTGARMSVSVEARDRILALSTPAPKLGSEVGELLRKSADVHARTWCDCEKAALAGELDAALRRLAAVLEQGGK